MSSLSSSAISIAVPEWDISLRAQALLSETPMEDRVKATFDLRIHPTDMNSLFEWNTDQSQYIVDFKDDADDKLGIFLRKQVYIPDGVTRGGETPSLTTHFVCSQSIIPISTVMVNAGVTCTKCNMIEEKILSVAEDIFNSTTAFPLFESQSRLLLSNDYYNLGREGLNHIVSKLTAPVATSIYQNIIAYRPSTSSGSTIFSEFVAGDELTFNVIAISSKSQYEITPNADRNLMDRSYKFRVVCDSGITAYHVSTNAVDVQSLAGRTTQIQYLNQKVMGNTTDAEYMSIFSNFSTITSSTVGSTQYIDPAVTAKLYATGSTALDGSREF